jgi:hypothetical protein
MIDDLVGDLKTALIFIDRATERFDPGLCLPADVVKVFGVAESLCRSAGALRIKAARGVEQSKIHETEGHSSAGSYIAGLSGQSVNKAKDTLEMARTLEAHPLIQAAFNKGKLSESQARQIAQAADVDPSKTKELIQTATKKSYGELNDACRRVKSHKLTGTDPEERYEQMRKKRFCRTWTDSEGYGRLEAKLMADSLGVVRAAMKPFEEQFRNEARIAGDHRSHDVYAADALVAMAICATNETTTTPGTTGAGTTGGGTTGGAGKPRRNNKPLVRIRVDYDALVRGHALGGETSEIIGGGDIPPSLASSYATDALLELIATRGIDVYKVVTSTRHIAKVLDIALEERDRTCCHSGCNVSYPLQRDHDVDFSKDGPTSLANLRRVCGPHHALKTNKKWRWVGTLGNMRLVPPDHPHKAASASRTDSKAPKKSDPPSTTRRRPSKRTPKQQSLLSDDENDP